MFATGSRRHAEAIILSKTLPAPVGQIQGIPPTTVPHLEGRPTSSAPTAAPAGRVTRAYPASRAAGRRQADSLSQQVPEEPSAFTLITIPEAGTAVRARACGAPPDAGPLSACCGARGIFAVQVQTSTAGQRASMPGPSRSPITGALTHSIGSYPGTDLPGLLAAQRHEGDDRLPGSAARNRWRHPGQS